MNRGRLGLWVMVGISALNLAITICAISLAASRPGMHRVISAESIEIRDEQGGPRVRLGLEAVTVHPRTGGEKNDVEPVLALFRRDQITPAIELRANVDGPQFKLVGSTGERFAVIGFDDRNDVFLSCADVNRPGMHSGFLFSFGDNSLSVLGADNRPAVKLVLGESKGLNEINIFCDRANPVRIVRPH